MKRTLCTFETFRHKRFALSSVGMPLCLGVAALCCVLAGCTVGPKYHAPNMQAPFPDTAASFKESPANFKNNGPWRVAEPQDAKLRGDWWTIFNDPELNALEAQLNINNQNIKLYFENFMESRAIVREARTQYFPTFGTTPAWNRQRSSANLRNSGNSVGSGGVVTN